MSSFCSHWSSSYITALSLVESFIVMKYFQSKAWIYLRPSWCLEQATQSFRLPSSKMLALKRLASSLCSGNMLPAEPRYIVGMFTPTRRGPQSIYLRKSLNW